MAYEYIELNLIPTGEKPVFHAAQYDVGRPIIIKLKNGEDDFTPTGLDLELQVRKVDNNIVTAVPDSVDGNVVTFLSTQQMTACSGTNLGKIQITKDDLDIATLLFYLVVQRDVLAGGLTSQSEIHDLEDQIAVLVPEVIGDEYYTAEQVDEKIAEIPTFDPDDYYDKTQLYTKTETNGLLAQKANTSSLAAVATSGSYNDLINKPNIPDVSDYYTKSETYSQNEVNTLLSAKADTSSLAAVATSGDYDDLLNKPTIPAAQVQADWSQADNTQVDFIKNKPTIPTNAELLPISSINPTNTKDYIDTITDIKSLVTFNENISGTNTNIVVKCGVLYIYYQGEAKAHNANDLLFTLPSGYRPSSLRYCTYNINDSAFGEVGIDTDGKCYINHISTSGANGRVYFAVAIPL